MELDIDYSAGCSNLNITDEDEQQQQQRNLYRTQHNSHHSVNDIMDTNQYRSGKKRRLSCADNEPSEKVFIKDSADFNSSQLLNLSDEVLLEILKNCNSSTLIAVSKTCRRLSNLVWDRRLWRVFDFSTQPLAAEKIMHRIKYVNKETKHIKVKGLVSKYPNSKWKNTTITFWILSKLRDECPELESLAIYDGYLNFEHMSITDFPNTLKQLTFSACEVNFPPPPKVFFNHIDYHLKNLEELSLERCRWFETHDLIIFSKLPRLKKLTLRGCTSLTECVPYGSIATRFGFRTLEVLDIRDTPVSDSDIQCFNVTTTLRELLMECPEKLRNINPTNSGASSSRTSIRFASLPPPDIQPVSPPHQQQQPADGNAQQQQQQQQQAQQPALQQQQQPDNNPILRPPNPANENRENHLIHIVVQDRNYLNINERIRHENIDGRAGGNAVGAVAGGGNGDEDVGDGMQAGGGDGNGIQDHPPGNGLRLVPPPEQQQLIIVRGNGNNDGRINRISWEIVNCNLQHPRQSLGRITRSGQQLTFEPPPVTLISDRGIQCFGVAKNNVQDNIVWIRAEERSPDTFIEKMVIRHYKLVTDISLRHLMNCAPNLKLLDVTGTSVTLEGVCAFKVAKPQCTVISDFFHN